MNNYVAMSEQEDGATNPEMAEYAPEVLNESVSENGTQTEEVQDAQLIPTNICPTFLTSGEIGPRVMAEESSTQAQDHQEVASHVRVTSDLGNSTASGEIYSSVKSLFP